MKPMRYQEVTGFNIKRRTFEGKTDPTKNNSSLTSKYMTSYKYWLEIEYDGYTAENCYPTKAECIAAVETAKARVGSLV
ncbi:hypothetical protein LCGC14_1134150 [marine sediment metagenome]|uniref:Uncharacterized protein n=1 Tax=marine sediment metagenome TaxID=412755 RepID=A0A0F9M0A6_9ZZZZ